MVRGGAAVSNYSRRGGLITRGTVRYATRYSNNNGSFRPLPRGNFIRNFRPSRFGIRRFYQGGGFSLSRRYGNISADRRTLDGGYRSYGTRGFGRFPGRGGGVPGRFQSTRGSARGRRGRGGGFYPSETPRFNDARRGRGGGRGRGRGRAGRGGRYRVTETELNAELDTYMGVDATKSRLDNQLDAFFGRTVTTSTATPSSVIKPDPLGGPSDVAMNGNSLP